MMKKISILVSVVLIGLTHQLFSQSSNQFISKLIDENNQAIAGAHVINLNLRIGTTTNDSGYFNIQANSADSLFISHIGFAPSIAIANDHLHSIRTITLKNQTTELNVVTIYALPSNFLDFKREFINLKLAADSIKTFHIPSPDFLGYASAGSFGITISGPFQALYDAYSKEAKQKRKLKQLQDQDRVELIRSKRYTPQVVMMLTGITDAESIERFMHFCPLNDEQIIAYNDYSLYMSILDCFQKYQKQYYNTTD